MRYYTDRVELIIAAWRSVQNTDRTFSSCGRAAAVDVEYSDTLEAVLRLVADDLFFCFPMCLLHF